MSKKKKYPKLPNGYGSIKHLSGKRRNPYAVYPPSEGLTINGSPIIPAALCYVDDWYKGFAVLTAYKAGNYQAGMEDDLKTDKMSLTNIGETVARMLSDYARLTQKITGRELVKEPTFSEVYEAFFKWKYEEDKSRTYSESTKYVQQAAYKHCAALYNIPFRTLRLDDLQNVIDCCPKKHATLEHIVSLIKQMYAYAEPRELCDKDYSKYLIIKQAEDDEKGVPFSDDQLRIFWAHKDDPVVEPLLIMCYSGYRISELKVIEVDMVNNVFRGGIKTRAGREREVPMHSSIIPIVKSRMKRYKCLMPQDNNTYRRQMYNLLATLNIEKHTPHDCRHTFSKLCEKYEVSENDRKRMLGHAFTDVTNSVYGHRDIEDLRKQIEKIKLP